jgi:hypothetical protein
MTNQLVQNRNVVARYLVSGLLVMFIGVASAQSAFDRADSNDNTFIDLEEFSNYMSDIFFHLDRDRSGLLEDDELDFLNPARLASTDIDDDGLVSMGEFLNSTAQDFFQLDRDRDSVLNSTEAR